MADSNRNKPGHTNYDWINGMRVGIIVGAVVGLLLGLAIGWFPFIWLIVGGAAGGVLGAKMADRW
jgi:uncharacterized membrane protein